MQSCVVYRQLQLEFLNFERIDHEVFLRWSEPNTKARAGSVERSTTLFEETVGRIDVKLKKIASAVQRYGRHARYFP